MDSLFTLVLMLVAITVFSIMLLAVFGLPATFAGTLSALCIGCVTAALRFWPSKNKD
ncbi:hypothetical protein [Marinibacterium profundimaris]|uniref:hypothetical protein n=1 Tax=Marinibacterium profundimaris TaxID=1679460 RepID=UPI001303E639|nr:hypothetical protein [Marinibacterium profundimaris]